MQYNYVSADKVKLNARCNWFANVCAKRERHVPFPQTASKVRGWFPFCDVQSHSNEAPIYRTCGWLPLPANAVIMGYFAVFPFEVLINRLLQW